MLNFRWKMRNKNQKIQLKIEKSVLNYDHGKREKFIKKYTKKINKSRNRLTSKILTKLMFFFFSNEIMIKLSYFFLLLFINQRV